jgi:hypothetical protein
MTGEPLLAMSEYAEPLPELEDSAQYHLFTTPRRPSLLVPQKLPIEGSIEPIQRDRR